MTILSDRLATAIKYVEFWLVNPVVAFLLQTPLHPLVDWRFVIIAWEGRQSGKRYSTPVLYREGEDGSIVFFSSSEHTNWWKNFRGGYPLEVCYRGEWHDAEGDVQTDEGAVEAYLRWLLSPLVRASRLFVRRQIPSDDWFGAAADGYVLVDVRLE